MPDVAGSETAFEAHEVVRADPPARRQRREGHGGAPAPRLRPELETGGELLLAARLAQALGAHNLAIIDRRDAEKRGMPLDLFSFPKDGLPADQLAAVDKAAVYAIARQESRFQVDAVSSAGARGLMQLMPATAKETARKIGRRVFEVAAHHRPGLQRAARLDLSRGAARSATTARWCSRRPPTTPAPGNANKWIRPTAIRARTRSIR